MSNVLDLMKKRIEIERKRIEDDKYKHSVKIHPIRKG